MDLAKQQPNYQPSNDEIIKVWTAVAGTVGVLLGPIIFWLVVSALLKLFTALTGDDGEYKKIFSISVFAYVPKLIQACVTTIIIKFINAKNLATVETSLALVLPTPSNPSKPGLMYTFLSQFDFFTIWTLILITIGAGVVFHISNKKSAIMVFGIFLAFFLFMTGTAALTSMGS